MGKNHVFQFFKPSPNQNKNLKFLKRCQGLIAGKTDQFLQLQI